MAHPFPCPELHVSSAGYSTSVSRCAVWWETGATCPACSMLSPRGCPTPWEISPYAARHRPPRLCPRRIPSPLSPRILMHATNLRSLKSAGGFFPSAPLALLVPSVLRAVVSPSECPLQVILPTASGVSNEGRSSPLLVPLPPFLGPGFRLGACWNRLGETVKMRKKWEKTGKKWARYGLKGVKDGS